MGKGQSKDADLAKEDLDFLLQNSKFCEKDIRDLYKTFIEDCPHGKLTPVKFQQMYSLFFPTGNVEQFSDYVFRSFDIDHDGFIDFREFMLAIGVTSSGSAVEKLKWAFRLYDTDRDGVVDQSEMISIVQAIHDMMGAHSKQSREQVRDQASCIFHQMDANKDGEVSEEEFLTACLRNEKLAQILAPSAITTAPLLRKQSSINK